MDVRLFSLQRNHQMHGGYSEVNIDCIKMLLITSEIQIQFMREKHYLLKIFEYVSYREVDVGFFNTLWLLPHLNQCTQFLPSQFFFRLTFLCTFKYHQSRTLLAFLWSVCWCMRMSTFLNFRRNFSNGIGNWALAYYCIQDDVWAVLRSTKWQQDYNSSCHYQAKICFG